MNRHRYEGAALTLLALIGSSATAMAQNAVQPAPAAATGAAGIGLSAGTTTPPLLDADANGNGQAIGRTLPPTPPPPPQAAQPELAPLPTALPPPPPPPPIDAANQTDHERVVGKYGVGILGVATLNNLQSNGTVNTVNTPIIGARRWVNDAWGLQAGLGLSHHSGTVSNSIPGQSNLEDPTYWGVAAHVGVPLALYHDKHYAFLFLPEANFGFSTWRQKDDKNTPGDQGVSGRAWLVDVGARAGAEIHFGFMDLPMLTLQGTVGAHVTYRDSAVKSVDASGAQVTNGHYTFDITTIRYNDPWDLFVGSIAALYYFK